MIRLAVIADIDRIVALGKHFHASTQYSRLIGASPDAMEKLAFDLITGADSDIIVSTTDDGILDNSIVGMLGLTAFQHPISGELFATEFFWWVEPEYRGRGVRLLRTAERWARTRGARALQMIAPTPEVADIYSRLGYEELETTYQLTLGETRTEVRND